MSADVRLIEDNEIVPYRDGVAADRPARAPVRHRRRAAGALSRVRHRRRARAAVGLAVDRIIGQREIVVRDDRRPAGPGRRHLRRDRSRRRQGRADPGSGDARARGAAADRPQPSARRRPGDASAHEARMTDTADRERNFIVFTVAGTTYALRSDRRAAHRDGRAGHPRAERGAVRRRRRLLARTGRAGGQPAGRFGFERAPYDLRTRLIVVQPDGRQRRADRRRRTRVPSPAGVGDSAAAGDAVRLEQSVREGHRLGEGSSDPRPEARPARELCRAADRGLTSGDRTWLRIVDVAATEHGAAADALLMDTGAVRTRADADDAVGRHARAHRRRGGGRRRSRRSAASTTRSPR